MRSGWLELIAVCLAPACRFDPAAFEGMAVDAPADCSAWHPQHFEPCAIPAPGGGAHLATTASPYTYDTTLGGGTLTDAHGVAIDITTTTIDQAGVATAVWSVAMLAIDPGVELDVIGDKPLIVAAWGSLENDGVIDAGSHPGRSGAGADPVACAAQAAGIGTDAAATGGSGGGGGGGFGGAGGDGGLGDAGAANVSGGRGGMSVPAPAIVRGGCPGASSGQAGSGSTTPSVRSSGGAGGGAIQLSARGALRIAGTVTSGGAGGEGAPAGTGDGGGGGGAGGFVGVDATSVTLAATAVVAANGGGGGGSGPFVDHGDPGEDGHPSTTPAAGGPTRVPAQACGVAGASGAAGATTTGSSPLTTDGCGGGGGGGGVGYVLVWSTSYDDQNATLSPTAIVTP
jgi:hypothetical protein